MMMRMMILGADGQVGRALAASAPTSVTALAAYGRADLDITNAGQIACRILEARPDLIINAAAWTDVEGAERLPSQAFAVNATGPGLLAEAAARHKARLVHISTDFVFDGKASRAYRPSDAIAPLNVYGASKAAGEQEVRQRLADALIVRTAWVYAMRGRNFVNTMLRLMAERDGIDVVADQIGTPTHAASLARGIWALVRNDARGVFHLTDREATSWHAFALAIQEEALASGVLHRRARIEPISTSQFPTRAKRPAFSVLDCSESWDCIGEAPRHWRDELGCMFNDLKRGMAA